jgi:hypothetical protein
MKRLEIRVPISPTPYYFRNVHFMAASLQRVAHRIGDYELVVCVGGDEEPRDLYQLLPWSNEYPLTWRWVDRERFRRDSYWETSHEIFRLPARGRLVMCADADVIFVRDFADLLDDLEQSPAVAGVIAHVSPFTKPVAPFADVLPLVAWQRLCQGYGVTMPPQRNEHTGWEIMVSDPAYRFTPPYFNFGMVVAPLALMDEISTEMAPSDEFVKSNLTTIYRFQIALTLAILKTNVPTRSLPLRYNFPNDSRFDEKYPEDLADIRILHYLRVQAQIVDRKKDFAQLANVAALISRQNLQGSNEIFRRCIEELYPRVAEEERVGAKSAAPTT